MNQFCPATMIARATLGTHNPRISGQTVTHRLREIGERPPYTIYVLYAAFLFWPSKRLKVNVASRKNSTSKRSLTYYKTGSKAFFMLRFSAA